MRKLELLAPAANIEIARQAILHGADAVYIGASSHGARKAASNSVDDIARLVEFAHIFRVRVYVTVNTLVYEKELKYVERLIKELWRAGVDALIVQDMSILRLDIPPIQLHASTQCDTRTVQKARFLEEVGFSQIVLARELSYSWIKEICDSVKVPVECFVHGALCVSLSGRCSASQLATGRSANRGECAQMCRLPYTLRDASGKVLARDKHLLSLKDFNLSDRIPELIEAGVSSFKIEGRLKDVDYVKNVTAAYRAIIDRVIARSNGSLHRSSAGSSEISFNPDLAKSFNRGFTHYFFDSESPENISSPDTPKSMGEVIRDISLLNNGDGISWFDKDGKYQGVNVNKVEKNKIITARPVIIPATAEIHRTYDRLWQQALLKPTAKRILNLDINVDSKGLSAKDERGVAVRIAMPESPDVAKKPFDAFPILSKLGNTYYRIKDFKSQLPPDSFYPASLLSDLRNQLLEALDKANNATYPFELRLPENKDFPYPDKELIFTDNVANSKAEEFYREHGVTKIQPALETDREVGKQPVAMTTRHCILRELGMCKKHGKTPAEPLTISSGHTKYRLKFNCRDCCMQLIAER